MEQVKKIFSILRNKYFVAIVVFAVIMLFTDHNNLFEQMDRKQELRQLQAKKAYYEQEIDKTKNKFFSTTAGGDICRENTSAA